MNYFNWNAVVFDLDGTLADTLLDIAEAANKALIKNGLSAYSIDDYRLMVGNGLRKLIERAAKNADPAVVEPVMADFVRIYDRDCLNNTRTYEGMPEAVAELKENGIRLFVVTNKPDAQARKIVLHLYGTALFDGVFGNCEGRKTKPDPELTLQVLAEADAIPERSLFVGDSDVDIFTAANAGMKSAGVTWGFRSERELKSAGADYIFHKSSDLIKGF